jgi:hypothetical protein
MSGDHKMSEPSIPPARHTAFLNDINKIREEMQQEERNAELRQCVKEFFEAYLNRVEVTEEGQEFSPIALHCCRAAMLEPLNNLLDKMAKLSGAKAKVTYEL